MLITFTWLRSFGLLVKLLSQSLWARHRAEARSSPNRADRSAMLPLTNPRETLGTTAALRHLARTVTRCHATAPRRAVSSSRPEDAAAPALWRRAARWRSATRQKHAAPLPVILGSLRAGCRPRTWRNNRPARSSRIEGRLCRLGRTLRRHLDGRRPKRSPA